MLNIKNVKQCKKLSKNLQLSAIRLTLVISKQDACFNIEFYLHKMKLHHIGQSLIEFLPHDIFTVAYCRLCYIKVSVSPCIMPVLLKSTPVSRFVLLYSHQSWFQTFNFIWDTKLTGVRKTCSFQPVAKCSSEMIQEEGHSYYGMLKKKS